MFRAKARSPIAESASDSRTGLGIENQMNRIHTNVAARLLIALGLLCASPAPGRAQTRPQDLASATLEDLLNIQITSASRKDQRADETPAAVSVLTQDDIHRSGIRTLPELFRLVPGVQVAQINSSTWAVSIRGLNDQFSNKLLVLIDGRSIYKRNFSGVFWDLEDVVRTISIASRSFAGPAAPCGAPTPSTASSTSSRNQRRIRRAP